MARSVPSCRSIAPTIAKLLVEEVISRHGVPCELLSDRGAIFMSKLLAKICILMGIKKVNTTAYHPQIDRLVECFNRIPLDMLSKTVKPGGQDWDARLPYVLFAYHATVQQSIGESPFFLLYRRDPHIPTEATLSTARSTICLDDYKTELIQNMSSAWQLVQNVIRKSQNRQKATHDKKASDTAVKLGDQDFVYMPAIRTVPAYKLAQPYKGPYCIVKTRG